jgi:hypothetical protein
MRGKRKEERGKRKEEAREVARESAVKQPYGCVCNNGLEDRHG